LFPKPAAAHAPVDLAPPVIPGYEVTRQIGSGGMGSVWLAKSDDESRDVTVKVLHPVWAADADAASRFEMEVDALASLTHPNIVELLDAGETADHQLFLATEYVDGCDLSHLLRGGTIPPERAIGIFRKVAAAISHAHESGIIHRDLKPANILVGAGDLVKVTDFGMAKHFSNSATRPTDAFGSPYYLAPELTRSASAVTPASDVYSLAVLLYEMLSGKLPLGSYTPLSALGHDKRLDRVIQNALRDDPKQRTASVADLLGGIERCWDAVESRAKWRKRAPWIAAASFIILGPLAGYAWNESRSKVVRPVFPPPARATKSSPWENSLGMKFIPVPDCDVLFSIHETRNSEWQVFRAMEESIRPSWRRSNKDDRAAPNRPVFGLQGWEDAPQSIAPDRLDHPAQGVSWQDAQFFCNWLTLKERQEGRLTEKQYYRLPTDEEWGRAAAGSPKILPGNYAGPEARTDRWPANLPTREAGDPFPETSPVGSFEPAPSGLFDLGGNALEWVEDVFGNALRGEENGTRPMYTLRGGSWAVGAETDLPADHRFKARQNRRRADYGFRCVLVTDGGGSK
jgi:serine/threonine protein kinase